ncbi:MAG TPA: AAA family ATPase [Nitrososphaerales archaeon]|nr:AAA family ATPase [Nitrososphaerales archaeon]
MRGIIGISGTPGTGKKTVAPIVAGLLGLPRAVPIVSFAPKGKVDVDTERLRSDMLKTVPPNAVLYGHLLPHVLKSSEAGFVAVLRCEPSVLRERLLERGYPRTKVTENVEAELIGVVLDECVARFGGDLVREYDTTSALPEETAGAIAKDAEAAKARGKKPAATAGPSWIDWTLRYDSSTKLRSLLSGGSAAPAST